MGLWLSATDGIGESESWLGFFSWNLLTRKIKNNQQPLRLLCLALRRLDMIFKFL